MNKQKPDVAQYPHRRKNILTGEWVLVSPHRMDRPWQGEVSSPPEETKKSYDPDCYLCPGNKRTNGETNPQYVDTFVFTNDYPALLTDTPTGRMGEGLLQSRGERGICRVVNFSARHDLTLAEMNESEIEKVIVCWQDEFRSLGADKRINYVQIFENKGSLMGNSNAHPHGQIWAQESIPGEPLKESRQFSRHYAKTKRNVLADYLKLEIKLRERIVFENESFVVLVPYWAVWPYETIIIPRKRIATILEFSKTEVRDFAAAISVTTVKYDNLFQTSFPYSAGLHQAPTDGKKHREWHFHMHFYPPLLRSAVIRKFMVGYEMLAEPQRDLTPEFSAKQLGDASVLHYRHTKGMET